MLLYVFWYAEPENDLSFWWCQPFLRNSQISVSWKYGIFSGMYLHLLQMYFVKTQPSLSVYLDKLYNINKNTCTTHAVNQTCNTHRIVYTVNNQIVKSGPMNSISFCAFFVISNQGP